MTIHAVSELLSRGELHTLGRSYLAGTIQIELHPLENLYLTGICNVADPSGLLKPRVIYPVKKKCELPNLVIFEDMEGDRDMGAVRQFHTKEIGIEKNG